MTNLSGTNLNNGTAVGPQGEGMDSPSTFPKYPAYKDSGVEWLGDVPEHWEVGSLRRLIKSVGNGTTADQVDEAEDTVAVSRIETISAGLINFEKVGHVGPQDVARRFLLNAGDILFSHINSLSMVGNVAIYSGGRPLLHGMNLLRIQPLPSISSEWLLYWLKSKNVRQEVESRAKPAINQASISTDSVRALPALIPPSFEQTQIARFLDHETAHIDALIEEQQRLIELLKEKRQAVISHAVTKGLDPTVPMKDSGVEWLGEVPAHWQVGALKHFISPVPGAIKTGPFGSHLKSEDMKEGPYKVFNQRSVIDADFSAGDNFISEEKFAELRGFTAFPGDVLVTTRGTIGRAAILPDNAEVGILHPCLLRVQVDESKITSSYLCRLIQESHLLKTQLSLMSNSTTIEVIYSETMANLLIPVPPITEQAQIAAFLDDVISKFGALTSDANESVRLLQERRSALISAAVTGKIDVRGWQPPASTQAPKLEEVAEAV
ncbi:restriction endonuclease subunit S [Pseudomonas wenzhouensis]|nr:restriction endonuclease subunit S [Pseudomonas wenzhouensis]MDM9652148.1 restriction endonuclease subunit S [Pseudomonas wenzhouensis]